MILVLVIWGWVLLLALAVLAVVKWPSRNGLIGALALVALAMPWLWATRSATFGIRHPVAVSPAGYQAWVEQQGLWTFSIHLVRDFTESVHCPSGQDVPPVQRVQWINDELLAVDRAGDADYVLDLAIYDDYRAEDILAIRNRPGRKIPVYDKTAPRPWIRDPQPAEAAYFTNAP